MIDFTPMPEYGAVNPCLPSTTLYTVLYPIPDFAAGMDEFLVESGEQRALFLERIVGSITLYWNNSELPAEPQVFWRLLPMGIDYAALTVLEPYTSPLDPRSSEWANLKWWDERQYVGDVNTFAGHPSTIDHPYWTTVDCNPRMMMGSDRNLWPVLAVVNFDAVVTLFVRHRLRALWKYEG